MVEKLSEEEENYLRSMEEDDDEDMEMAENENYYVNEDMVETSEKQVNSNQTKQSETLDDVVIKISHLVEGYNMSTLDIRFELFERELQPLFTGGEQKDHEFEKFILSSDQSDAAYNSLILAMMPHMEIHMDKPRDISKRPLLINLLDEAINTLTKKKSLTDEEKSTESEDVKATEVEDSDTAVDQSVVSAIVNDVMKVYEQLYKPLFINKPKGILTSQGILTVDKNGKPYLLKSDLSTLENIYGAFNQYTKGYLQHKETIYGNLNASYFNNIGNLVYTYCPLYHAQNIYGWYEENGVLKKETNWLKFRVKLKNSVTSKIVSSLKQVDEGFDIDTIEGSMKELMTNCIVIQEFDRTKVLAMTYRLGVEKHGIDMSRFPSVLVANQKTVLKAEVGQLIDGAFDNFNIGNFLYAYDADNYNKEILFSYKLFDKMAKSGITPSSSNLILGRKLNGEDYGINFSAQNNIVTSIIAGSGSGKGVVTLNVLASLLASDSPVVYMDFKPDMSAMLWELERELGAKILSVDSKENRHKFGTTPIRNPGYGLNAPQGFEGYLDQSHWAITPYLKIVQLACVAAAKRSSDESLMRGGKLYFIFDELQTMNAQFGETVKKMEDFVKKYKKDPEKADAVAYAEKYLTVYNDNLKSAVSDLLKTSGRNGLVGCVVLGQSVNPADWKFGGKGWENSPLVSLMTDSNYRLAGAKHRTKKSGYSLDGIKYSGSSFIDSNTMGYFAVHPNFVPPDDGKQITTVKSYLTLNANDVEKALESGDITNPNPNTFVGGLLGNISDMSLRERIVTEDMYNPDGTVNERIGFAGLIKSIMNYTKGGNLSDAELTDKLRNVLSKSYDHMLEIMHLCGLNYSTVEEYLYDCSIETMYAYGELKSGVMSQDETPDEDTGANDWLNETPQVVNTPNLNQPNQQTNQTLNQNPSFVVDEGDQFRPPNTQTDQSVDNQGYTDFDYMPNETGDVESQQPRAEYQQQNQYQNPVETEQYVSPNKQMHYDNVYQGQMSIPQNPFKTYSRSEKPISAINAIKMMTNYIMQEIQKVYGDFSRIHSFEATNNGIVINNIAFRPSFDQDVIESMPLDIKNQVARGNLIELFHFGDLLKFRNLEILRIDNSRLAEGRVRREIGLSPRKGWFSLFNKFRNLQELYIGGERITDEETSQRYDDNGRGGFSLTERLRESFKMPASVVSNSRMERVWDSKPVRVMGGALGWTLGIKAVTVAATMFGPWGLIFGAFAGYSAYQESKNRRNQSGRGRDNNNRRE